MRNFCFLLFCLISQQGLSQHFEVLSGPVYGHFTDEYKHFWMLVEPNNTITNDWATQFNVDLYTYFRYKGYDVKEVNQSLTVLDRYVVVKGKIAPKVDTLPERSPDTLEFLVGSCAFSYPWGFWSGRNKEAIFEPMTAEAADFMIWMGDNVYYLFGEWKSKRKMLRKNVKARLRPRLKAFLESCPQYAIWDDHDYGPNNSDKNNPSKYNALDVFKTFWANPSFGLDTVQGVFTHFQHEDAAFFLLDSRFYADADSGELYGSAQLEWLKEGLRKSEAKFNFIVSGTQFLGINPHGEDFGDYDKEKNSLLQFLKKEKISGVVFLSGDLHYAEYNTLERINNYNLHEFTTSPLTSFQNPTPTKAENTPCREPETFFNKQNYGKISITDEGEDRLCLLQLFDRDGQLVWERKLRASELEAR